jgi:hypothetical protein
MRIGKMLRSLFRPRPPPPPPRPADPRLDADPWLGELFARLGERYQLGPDGPEGARVLRRTGRARFNPMPVWLRPKDHVVRADYEVRGEVEAAKALLDTRVTGHLTALGLSQAGESVEEWAGTVLTRTYAGRCDTAAQAAEAVRFVCQNSETQTNLAAE